MQIICELIGYYECLANDGKSAPQTSLINLLTDLHAIATHQHRHYLPAVHQSFGLNFLPINTLTHLMQQTSRRSPLIAEKTLRPLIQASSNLESHQFQFRFVSTEPIKNFIINLAPDDPQIPLDFGESFAGVYYIELDNISDPLIQDIQAEAVAEVNQFIETNPYEILNLSFSSINLELISVPLTNNSIVRLHLSELPQFLQQAIRALRNGTEAVPLTEVEQEVVNTYFTKYPDKRIISDHIPDLAIANVTRGSDIKIGRGNHRRILQDLIANAKEFLLICSFRLEDEAIIEMIVERSKQIPVWILTDFSNEVQDRVDSSMDKQREVYPEYENADRQKRECLRKLSRANLRFRSGNFHIKTYISEQSAYLGSCNLTGGSLERNGEAGMLWHNTPEHEYLVEYFRYLWTNKTLAQAIPYSLGFRIESIEKHITTAPISDRFLDNAAFKRDLTRSLMTFVGKEIRIYTRNFQPLSPQLNLLTHRRNRIFYGKYNATELQATKIYNLHAKIIIIGSQVAYIGSQDFSFTHSPMLDLTYKTHDPQEINMITQQAQKLH